MSDKFPISLEVDDWQEFSQETIELCKNSALVKGILSAKSKTNPAKSNLVVEPENETNR